MEHTILLTFDTSTNKPFRLRLSGAKADTTVAEVKALGNLMVAHDPFYNGIIKLREAELQNSSESAYVL
ncbi:MULTISPECIES: DUF2922 domain-containing protein [Exiguobacterium]|uniref:DUF2922 domain-containing protein n=1 Tax=Exiguobacterium oxidotolerans TaxID=223958 RepID=A0A653II22_9BACL|nr:MULTISPECIES: DUF2922 domain-containing protein [Exiguobacterium]ASI35180.1 DUF2922 domain-containing protein [Exiguobacterium sp. N4-1P]ASI37193.1 DUF2922 domain-containing protein [Exiguobacterium sp. N4-1P]VWX38797.1 conserved hypothetical protein [Exiguobacterium oxidotolerans]